MRTTNFEVKNRILNKIDSITYTGDLNVDTFLFDFDDEWQELDKTLVLIIGEKTYNVALINDEAVLPNEAYLDNQSITVGVFGKKGDTILSSNLINIWMTKGAYVEGQEPDNLITPTQWDLYVEEINRLLSEAKASEEECQKALEEVRLIQQKMEEAELDIDEYNSNHDEKMKAYNSNSEQKTTEYNNNATQKIGAYNTNDAQKTSAYNLNAEQKTTAFNENYTEKLNSINTAEDTALDNINTETEKFNTNAEEKLNSFNSNSTNKVNEFNENVTSKTTAFDANAVNKTDEFNSNYEEKLGLFNEDANVQRIADLESEVESLNQDLNGVAVNSEELIGESLTVNDSADKVRFKKFSVQGTSVQKTRSGKNLFNENDIDNLAIGALTGDVAKINTGGIYRGFYCKVHAGKTYTISRKNTTGNNRFRITFTIEEPANGVICYDEQGVSSVSAYINADNLMNKTVTVPDNVNYIFIYLSNGSETIDGTQEIQLEEGPTATEYEPYGASPTPEYPSEIKNVADVNGKIVGKNRIDFDNYMENIFTESKRTKLSDGSWEIKHNDSKFDLFTGLLKAPSTLSFKTKSSEQRTNTSQHTFNFRIYFEDETYQDVLFEETTTFTEQKKTFDRNIIKISNIYNSVSPYTIIKDVQLEEGSIATPYTPYQEQTFAFPLAENQKMYQDSYLAEDGIHHKREQVVFNGSESWSITEKGENNAFWMRNSEVSNCLNLVHPKLCDKFTYINASHRDAPTPCLCENSGLAPMIIFNVPSTMASTVDEWKTYLSNNPLTLEFNLAEEEIIPYTAEQKQAYDLIKKLYTFKGTTHVFFEDEVSPKADLIYRKDIETLINNLAVAIIALGG